MASYPSLPLETNVPCCLLIAARKSTYASAVQAIPMYLVLGTTCWTRGKGGKMVLVERNLRRS